MRRVMAVSQNQGMVSKYGVLALIDSVIRVFVLQVPAFNSFC